jgi:divalent metal cation (Fe/Co/Zn/Cd) transporter
LEIKTMPVAEEQSRSALVLSGKQLEYFTIIWHLLEGAISLVAGLVSGSLSLVGFGVDSLIELVSGAAVWWRMTVDGKVEHRERNEKLTLRLIGASFIALAGYLIFESVASFVNQKAPEPSIPGIVIAILSLVVMPLLSWAKRNLAAQLKSPAMKADATQADFCAYLSAILLVGLLVNFWLGWWWADPVAALIMAVIIGNEGIKSSLGDPCCEPHS